MASAVPPVQWFKRSQSGLYAGKQRLAGNTISPSKRQCVVCLARLPRWAACDCALGAGPAHTPPSCVCLPHTPPSVKRHWLPNVQRKALYSEALGKSISLKVTTYALRQMDRMGAF